MMMEMSGDKELHPVEKMRAPFPANQISKLPKETRAQIDERKSNKSAMLFNCPQCGGHHHKNAVHLDYVGHAALTDRLLDTDIEWSWEPVAFNAQGLPAFDQTGGLWIKLTIHGVTRLGYGSADGKTGGDAIKEVIGDALRNAAMRFGAALDLWHKGDLHAEDETPNEGLITQSQLDELNILADETGSDKAKLCAHYKVPSLDKMNNAMFVDAMHKMQAKKKDAGNEQ